MALFLIDSKATFKNYQDKDTKKNAMMIGVENQYTDFVKFLISHNADLTLTDSNGDTLLTICK